MTKPFFSPSSSLPKSVTAALVLSLGLMAPAEPSFANTAAGGVGNTGFRQAVAEQAWEENGIAAFYRSTGYAPLWTGTNRQARKRRRALMVALQEAGQHGLPDQSAKAAALMEQMRDLRTTRDLGAVEVALSRALVDYARALQTGLLVPRRIDDGMVRRKRELDVQSLLQGLSENRPAAYIKALAPQSAQYGALLREKQQLEELVLAGGWGPQVPQGPKIEAGASGNRIVALRNRMIAMGYLRRSATKTYDDKLQAAVRAFQANHGLAQDGVIGDGTLAEINRTAADRLKSVIVAMERERWLTPELGARHVLVNQTDFTAKIIDNGRVSFETRSVIGKNTHDRRSPEFSDEMEHMVINPSWYVPRSIVTKEYLPKLRENPNAHSYIEMTDNRGRVVNRGAVDFTQFTEKNFPFAMRQPPSARNALGLVKFMFPNKYNIYLHDTPQKALFSREVRAFSHGCIRLAQPFDFAYEILSKQESSPKAYFHRVLDSGRETKVVLDQKIPVHIIYRTAMIDEDGVAQFRRDIYGRDAKIWAALQKAGVVLPGVQS